MVSFITAAPIAFGAGLLSFLSPCVLPLVPAYLGHLAGTSGVSGPSPARLRAVSHAAAFVLGFSLVFTGVWIALGLVGLVAADAVYRLRPVAGLLLVVMGLHYSGLLRIPFLDRELRPAVDAPRSGGLLRSLVIGALFAAGWTPCIGPALAGIIALAASQDTVVRGSLLLWAYAAGLGVPFLLAALALRPSMRVARWFGRRPRLVHGVTGGLLIVMGMLVLSGALVRLQALDYPGKGLLG